MAGEDVPGDVGDIDRALDRLTLEMRAIFRRIEHKLDALVASNVKDASILKTLTEQLAQAETELEQAVNSAKKG